MAFEMFVDDDGVPYSDYGVYHGIQIGRQRSVLSVAERGLWYWNSFAMGGRSDAMLLSYKWDLFPKDRARNPQSEKSARAMLSHCAQWLLHNLQRRDDFLVWEYPYPMSYGTKAGWCSAHAQATGMQLLVRMHELTGEPGYLSPIPGLLRAFRTPIRAGGLLDDATEGVVWYEKFADPGNSMPKVLNGMLFAIIGLQDVASRINSEEARELALAGIGSAMALLPRFDLGDWSAYDILGKPASPHYHAIHIRQLALLHGIFGDPALERFLLRFVQYQRDRDAAAS